MADDFFVPASPEELLDDDVGGGLKVSKDISLADLDPEDIYDLAENVVRNLCDLDALDLLEQRIFDQVYSLIRGFKQVPVVPRKRLLDALTSNLSVLNASIGAALAGGNDVDPMATQQQRSGLKAYVFFLHWATEQCEAEAREAAPAAAAAAGGRGRGRKKGAEALATWDWEAQRAKVARVLCSVSEVDLAPLFAPAPVEDAFLQLWMKFAQQLLDQPDPAALRNKQLVEGIARTLAATALRYGQVESVAHGLFDVLNKHEHIPAVIADIAEFASHRNHDNRLAVELLRQVAGVDPADYERQMAATAASVRAVGSFIAELADRLPRTVGAHVALLVPHLGCKAYPIRSGIVYAIGHLIARGFEAPEEDSNAPANVARLRTKQGLLDLLVERARDQTSWTRGNVCKAWASLTVEDKVPMGHWLTVTQLAIGRLEDKSANVRKVALQLLATLLLNNPFGPHLPAHKFTVTLEEHKQKLKELLPDEDEDAGSGEDEAEPAETQQEVRVKAEQTNQAESGAMEDTQAGGAADMDTSEGAAANAADGDIAENQQPPTPACKPGQAGLIEDMRGIVASLEAAVAFTNAVAGAMPTLTQLLASSSVADVQEAIGLLVTCHKFQIDGAAAAIRKMLPLIFSREQAVKDAVVDAVDELYLGNCDAEAAADNLVGLAQGSSLGELGSLEDVMKALMHKGLLNDRTLKALWGICGRAAAARDAGAAEAEAQMSRTRASLALIAMVAAQQPATVQDNLDTLLQVGFGAAAADAMVTQYACKALCRLAVLPGRRDARQLEVVTRALAGVLVAPRVQPAAWYSAAEAATAAIYALHPAPGALCAAIVHQLAGPAISGGPADSGDGSPRRPSDSVSAVHLSRLFFTVGQVALQHLMLVEKMAKAVRRQRADAEKEAAEAHNERAAAGESQGPEHSHEDINKELGVGAMSADLELDALKDAADAEILAVHGALGRYVPLIAAFCRSSTLMAAHANLRASALLALTKLMAIEPAFCDRNLRLLFTLLQNRSVEPAVRSNLVIAIGDLAFRFPNLLEPWTPNMYLPLSDSDDGVRKNALMVLTHLILNDMMKVKGHIAKMAVCLQDGDARIRSLAHLFFEELSHKVTKNVNPIYNLLPDILSSLGTERDLPDAAFQAIMHVLLGYVKRDKYVDPLAEKLAHRLGVVAEEPAAARNIAFCIGQLALSDKALRRLADLWKVYHLALADEGVLSHFQAIVEKVAKRDKKTETRELVDDWEAKIAAKQAELAEERETAAAKAAAAAAVKPEPEAEATAGPEQPEADGTEDMDAEPLGSAAAAAAADSGVSSAAGLRADMDRLQLADGGDGADSAPADGGEAALAMAVKSEPLDNEGLPPRRASRGAARASMAADATAPLVAVKPEPVEYEDSAATEPSTAKPLAAAAPASAARPPRRTAARRSARVSAAGAAPDGADAAAAEVASQAANAAVRRQSAAGVASPAADAPAAAAAPKSQRRRGRLTKAKDVAPRRSSARASAAGASDNEESAAAAYGDENEVGSRPVARGRLRGGGGKQAAARAGNSRAALRNTDLEDWSSEE